MEIAKQYDRIRTLQRELKEARQAGNTGLSVSIALSLYAETIVAYKIADEYDIKSKEMLKLRKKARLLIHKLCGSMELSDDDLDVFETILE